MIYLPVESVEVTVAEVHLQYNADQKLFVFDHPTSSMWHPTNDVLKFQRRKDQMKFSRKVWCPRLLTPIPTGCMYGLICIIVIGMVHGCGFNCPSPFSPRSRLFMITHFFISSKFRLFSSMNPQLTRLKLLLYYLD